MENITTIALSTETREMLKGFGSKGETYDQIIRNLAEIARRHEFFERQKWILKNEKFYKAEEL